MADAALACPDENALSGLVEGRLDGEALAALEAHVDGCEACAALLADLAVVLAPEGGTSGVAARTDRFRITGELGSGAMGVVHAAFDTKLRRRVALKRIRPDLSLTNPAGARDAQARLMREARLLAGVSHPNIVALHDVETTDDEIILVQELVDGRSVDAWLEEAPRPWREIVAAFEQAARGLHAAHRAGLVHRDVKPSNLLMGDDGRVRVSDFGLARLVSESRGSIGTHGASALTATGAIVGTPAYMAPEQLMAKNVDARSDQYGLGVALIEALVGERPLPGSTPEDLESAATAHARALPDRNVLLAACRAIRARPSERWSDMATFADALREEPSVVRAATLRPTAEAPPPPTARRRAAYLFGALAVGAVAALAFTLTRPGAQADAASQPAAPAVTTGTPPVVAEAPASTEAPLAATSLPAPPSTTLAGPMLARGADGAMALAPGSAPGTAVAAAFDTRLFGNAQEAEQMRAAQRLLAEGKGIACLAKLDEVDKIAQTESIKGMSDNMRSQCELLAGQCNAGRQRLKKQWSASNAMPGATPDEIEAALDRVSPAACKSPRARAKAEAEAAATVTIADAMAVYAETTAAVQKGDVAECRKVGAKAMRLAQQPGVDPSVVGILTSVGHSTTACVAGGGDCDAARKSFFALYPKMFPEQVANGVDAQKREQAFLSTYRACAKP